MSILFIDDVCRERGRDALLRWLPGFDNGHAVAFACADGESVVNGASITSKLALKLLGGGVNVLTTGNRVCQPKEVHAILAAGEPIMRPANYPKGPPGRKVTERPAGADREVAVVSVDTRAPREHRGAAPRGRHRGAAPRASDFPDGQGLVHLAASFDLATTPGRMETHSTMRSVSGLPADR